MGRKAGSDGAFDGQNKKSAQSGRRQKPEDTRFIRRGGGNLYLRVAPGGSKGWIFRFTLQRKNARRRSRELPSSEPCRGSRPSRQVSESKWRTASTQSRRAMRSAPPSGVRLRSCDVRAMRQGLHRQPRGGMEERQAPGAVALYPSDLCLPPYRPFTRQVHRYGA